MLPRIHPDRVCVSFEVHRLVATTELILPATLALRPGLPQLIRKHNDLGCSWPGLHRRQTDDDGGLRPCRRRPHQGRLSRAASRAC